MWMAGLPDETHDKLVKWGLAKERPRLKLGEFLESWFESKSSDKETTITVRGHAKRNLLDFFGSKKDIRAITEEDAEQFSRFLRDVEKLAPSTRSKRIDNAKRMFKAAVKSRTLDNNPFQDLQVTGKPDKSKQKYVTLEQAEAIAKCCPDTGWRAAFMLARFGAFRGPCEFNNLRWCDIDWENGWMTVRSRKTAKQDDGKEFHERQAPLFYELQPILKELMDESGHEEYVLPREVREHKNPGTKLRRAAEDAGQKIPKLLMNLRATRATELFRVCGYKSYTVSEWCGHSERIADEHYRMVLDIDHKRATEGPLCEQPAYDIYSGPNGSGTDLAHSGTDMAQQTTADSGIEMHTQSATDPDAIKNLQLQLRATTGEVHHWSLQDSNL